MSYTVTCAPFLSETMNPKQMWQVTVRDTNGNIEFAQTAESEDDAKKITRDLQEQYSNR